MRKRNIHRGFLTWLAGIIRPPGICPDCGKRMSFYGLGWYRTYYYCKNCDQIKIVKDEDCPEDKDLD